MKKKFKLLTSIASLGLALAVMAFGVFAAVSHTLTVTNTVKFDVGKHIAFTISGSATSTGAKVQAGDPLADVEDPSYALKTVTNNDANGILTDWTAGTAYILEVGETITWSFEVTNLGSNDITVRLSTKDVGAYWGDENTNWTLTATPVEAEVDGAAVTLDVVFTLLKAPSNQNGEGAVNFTIELINSAEVA